MSTQTLQLPPSYPASISIRFEEIVREFGGGYDTSEIVGPTDGTILLKFNYGHLPAGTSLVVSDPEDGGASTPWAKYLWKFFIRRKQDGEAFNVVADDPATGTTATWLVKFADSQLDYELLTYKLYSSGVALRQWRALS